MAAQLTIPQTISIGKSSISFSNNDLDLGCLFGERKIKLTTPVLIAYTTDALNWYYEDFPNDETLRGVANYLYWLCGKYGMQARAGSGGGGSVIPVNPSFITSKARRDFYVTDSTLLVTGQSTATFNDWIGYELIFVRGNVEQSTASNGTDSYFTWNKATGEFFCYGAVMEDELISLIPYQ